MAVPQDEFVAHYRVSTGRPGKNGLGLEARRRSGHKFQGRQLAWPTSLKWRGPTVRSTRVGQGADAIAVVANTDEATRIITATLSHYVSLGLNNAGSIVTVARSFPKNFRRTFTSVQRGPLSHLRHEESDTQLSVA
jgi:hypothetical protein